MVGYIAAAAVVVVVIFFFLILIRKLSFFLLKFWLHPMVASDLFVAIFKHFYAFICFTEPKSTKCISKSRFRNQNRSHDFLTFRFIGQEKSGSNILNRKNRNLIESITVNVSNALSVYHHPAISTECIWWNAIFSADLFTSNSTGAFSMWRL